MKPSDRTLVLLAAGVRVSREGVLFFFSSRRRHTRFDCDWSSDVCSSDLELGARDYVAKPFALDELIARVRVQLRAAGLGEHEERLLRAGPLELDLARRRRSEERRVGKECRARWSPDH